MGRLLEDAGFAVTEYEFDERRTSLVARLGGHADTLAAVLHRTSRRGAAGRPDLDARAFAGEIDGGRLYGRGSSDMKSGVAAFVVAVTRLARHLRTSSPGVVLVSPQARRPSATARVTWPSLDGVLGQVGAIVVAEPTCNYPFVGHKGALWLRARTSGVTAHGSMPERGVNAIYKAARAALRLEQLRLRRRAASGAGGARP